MHPLLEIHITTFYVGEIMLQEVHFQFHQKTCLCDKVFGSVCGLFESGSCASFLPKPVFHYSPDNYSVPFLEFHERLCSVFLLISFTTSST